MGVRGKSADATEWKRKEGRKEKKKKKLQRKKPRSVNSRNETEGRELALQAERMSVKSMREKNSSAKVWETWLEREEKGEEGVVEK